jgi:hypothetical protein
MKTSMGRMYASSDQAQDAITRLKDIGINESRILFVAPGTDQGEAMKILHSVPASDAFRYARSAQAGHAVVVVEAFFGQGQYLGEVMNAAGPVSTEDLPIVRERNPAPFSRWIGMPTLSTRGRSYFKAFGELNHFSFSSKFGLKLLSNNPAPLSKMLGLKTLSEQKGPWTKSFGFPLLTRRR